MKKMIKCLFVFVLFSSCLLYAAAVSAAAPMPGEPGDVSARLRLYEGFRHDTAAPAKIISSYYLKAMAQKNTVSEVGIRKEIRSLKRVFNMERIKLVTDAAFLMKEDGKKSPFQVIVLNGRKLLLQLSPINTRENRFKVEVFEEGVSKKSLFRSTIILPQKKTTALGFEDSTGKIYFLSFQRSKDLKTMSSGNPGNTAKSKSSDLNPVSGSTDPVTVTDPVKRPKLLKRVNPVYPKVALKSKISGQVVMEAVTDIKGQVVKVAVVEGPELLRKSSIEAIRQWKYEPYIVDGKKCPVKFTVVMNYRLHRDKKKEGPINLSSVKVPKLLKRVEPKYPKSALKKGISGVVVLEATTDKEGNVAEVIVMEGPEELRSAAVDTLKQWKYSPVFKKGKKCEVRFTVIIKFKLDGK